MIVRKQNLSHCKLKIMKCTSDSSLFYNNSIQLKFLIVAKNKEEYKTPLYF